LKGFVHDDHEAKPAAEMPKLPVSKSKKADNHHHGSHDHGTNKRIIDLIVAVDDAAGMMCPALTMGLCQ